MLQFNKPESVLLSAQETVTKTLQLIVGVATVHVVVDTIRPLPDNWYIHVHVHTAMHVYMYNVYV